MGTDLTRRRLPRRAGRWAAPRVVFLGTVELARVAQLVVVVVQYGAHLAPQADILLEMLGLDRRGALVVELAGVAHFIVHRVHGLARVLALVDAPVGVKEQFLDVALDGDLEAVSYTHLTLP